MEPPHNFHNQWDHMSVHRCSWIWNLPHPWCIHEFWLSFLFQQAIKPGIKLSFPFHKPQIHQSFPNREKENTNFGPHLHTPPIWNCHSFFVHNLWALGTLKRFAFVLPVRYLESPLCSPRFLFPNTIWSERRRLSKFITAKKHFKSTLLQSIERYILCWDCSNICEIRGKLITVLVSLPIHFTHKTCRCFLKSETALQPRHRAWKQHIRGQSIFPWQGMQIMQTVHGNREEFSETLFMGY